MNKKILLAIVGIVAALSVATLIITRSTQYDDGRTEFRIGVIAPLTGENATVGQTCRQAVEFAVAKIYNPYIRYRVFIEDGRFQSARSASAAHRLISRNRVSAIITCDAPSAAAVAPIAETSGVFMISTISSAEENIVDNHHVFLNWTLPSAQTTLAHKMLQAANINRMVIFELNHPGAQAIGDSLRTELSSTDIAIETIVINPGERNFADIVMRAQRFNPDAYMILTLPPTLNILMQRLAEVGDQTQRFSIEVPTFVEDRTLFEGVKFVDIPDGNPYVINAYRTKFNTENIYGVIFVIDSVTIIDTLVSRHYTNNGILPTGTEMADALLNMQTWGGGKIDRYGRIHSSAVIKKIQNGRVITIQ